MKRKIINIDEDKCNGCGLCIPNCHEGALQIIDGKARLISDLFCDGLGACLGHCPEGAISMEEREAEPYNETKVMEKISKKGRNTILAHIRHLKEHGEEELLKEAVAYIRDNNIDMSEKGESQSAFETLYTNKNNAAAKPAAEHFLQATKKSACGGGCPGEASIDFKIDQEQVDAAANKVATTGADAPSELSQWPVQMHLINPQAGYFKNADMVLAASCVAFTMGNFHSEYLKGRRLGIACPKLDSNKEIYVEKLVQLIDQSRINTLTVVMMEVPCCGGLLQMAQIAVQQAQRKIPIKRAIIGLQGQIIQEDWI